MEECMEISTSNPGCYTKSVDDWNNYLTEEAKFKIQDNSVQSLTPPDEGEPGTIIGSTENNVLNDPDMGSQTCIRHNDDNSEQNKSCLTQDQWSHLKILRTFISNYNEWKEQERAAIQKEIDEYSLLLTDVMGKVNNMIVELDKLEVSTSNEVKQEHMIKELSDLLSTYDRRMEVAQSDQEYLDKKIAASKRTINIMLVFLLLGCVLMYYIKSKK